MGKSVLTTPREEADVARDRHQDQGQPDSPAVRLLEALRRGDDAAVVALCGETTTVWAENMAWSFQGPDAIEAAMVAARERFPGLTFESSTRHVGFGLVIEEARVRDVEPEPAHSTDRPGLVEAIAPADEGELTKRRKHRKKPQHAAVDEEVEVVADPDGSDHPMWDEPSIERRGAMTVWRDRGGDDQPPAPLNMPVRVTVRHDDLQVHDITLSFPAALLKRALGMHVDPLEISLSEVQSAFIAPVGAGFRTHALSRPELTLVPPPPVEEPPARPADEEEEPPRRRRRRGALILPMLIVLAALLLGGGYWYSQRNDTSTSAGGPATHPSATPSVRPSVTPSASPYASTSPQASTSPSETPTHKPNVTLESDLAFATNSANLSVKAKAAIAQVARQVKRAGLHGTIYVDGYTDNQGSNDGMALSRRRADAVAAILRHDLAKENINVVAAGHGEADPVANNDTAAGRAKNRRVTITLPQP
jgi:outer membrane protein OmpA-like peptidoglycan-associated protein